MWEVEADSGPSSHLPWECGGAQMAEGGLTWGLEGFTGYDQGTGQRAGSGSRVSVGIPQSVGFHDMIDHMAGRCG